MLDSPPTPLATLRRAADLGREAGLAHVYVGNAPELGLEDTRCAGCGRVVIERHGYATRNRLTALGTCVGCGRALAGVAVGAGVSIGVPDPLRLSETGAVIREPAVAGAFYPAEPGRLAALVARVLAAANRPALDRALVGLLVPHAGLVYSGVVAAAGWHGWGCPGLSAPVTVVLLGTNHGAGWLDGVAAWGPGAWRTPLGDVAIDAELTEAVLALGPPFMVDPEAHLGEHSLEVQLPILQTVAPQARIVPLAVSTGTGADAVAAGARLGDLLARRRAAGYPVVLAISSDMAHYPAAAACAQATVDQLPPILDLDPTALAAD